MKDEAIRISNEENAIKKAFDKLCNNILRPIENEREKFLDVSEEIINDNSYKFKMYYSTNSKIIFD